MWYLCLLAMQCCVLFRVISSPLIFLSNNIFYFRSLPSLMRWKRNWGLHPTILVTLRYFQPRRPETDHLVMTLFLLPGQLRVQDPRQVQPRPSCPAGQHWSSYAEQLQVNLVQRWNLAPSKLQLHPRGRGKIWWWCCDPSSKVSLNTRHHVSCAWCQQFQNVSQTLHA